MTSREAGGGLMVRSRTRWGGPPGRDSILNHCCYITYKTVQYSSPKSRSYFRARPGQSSTEINSRKDHESVVQEWTINVDSLWPPSAGGTLAFWKRTKLRSQEKYGLERCSACSALAPESPRYMPLTPSDVAAAQAIQDAAAHDSASQVRLIAGPGTGKSQTIQERVLWLLDQSLQPGEIVVVSFTRASARDLERRIHKQKPGRPSAAMVRVSTLHSLALRTLRHAGMLWQFPVDPIVLDDWELENIFDAEFQHHSGINSKVRREDIRRYKEAIWSTGAATHPGYRAPTPPISPAEDAAFDAYHSVRTRLYSCVLPGEIVRQCVDSISAGLLDPVRLFDVKHVIVDEYQDLNPYDLRFIDQLVSQGAIIFVAGDDDQSIYSFRYATPDGIQDFTTKYPSSSTHTLGHCFRCTASVLTTAYTLIAAHPAPKRITKTVTSLYATASPPEGGLIHRWRLKSDVAEARAVAESCHSLIAAGMPPNEIMILLSAVSPIGTAVMTELDRLTLPYEAPRERPFSSSDLGRALLAFSRIVLDSQDYVAHRSLLGLLPRVGTKTTNEIAHNTIAANLNYRDIFYTPLPAGVFDKRCTNALTRARALIAALSGWSSSDTLGARSVDLRNLLAQLLAPMDLVTWDALEALLPPELTFDELRAYAWADTQGRQAAVVDAARKRISGVESGPVTADAKIRIMTMHGAKGLAATVVFIPGLEDTFLPGAKRVPYPGLVLESARLLFVSLSRARATCILSFAHSRLIQGSYQSQTACPFCASLGGAFQWRTDGLNAAEVAAIIASSDNL